MDLWDYEIFMNFLCRTSCVQVSIVKKNIFVGENCFTKGNNFFDQKIGVQVSLKMMVVTKMVRNSYYKTVYKDSDISKVNPYKQCPQGPHIVITIADSMFADLAKLI